MTRLLSGSALLALGLLLAPAPPLEAQVCGDVDGDGRVTVSDGVAILRAAAGLASPCVPALCDVDQDGTVGASDGVLALRRAAALPIVERCGTGSVTGRLTVPILAAARHDEREPNDGVGTAQSIGRLGPGEHTRLEGSVGSASDAFDGFAAVVTAPLTLELALAFDSADDLDLDLLVLDPASGEALACESTGRGREACAVAVGSPTPRRLDVVVVPAAGSLPSVYRLDVHGGRAGAAASALAAGPGAAPPLALAVETYRELEADFVPGELVVMPAGHAAATDARGGPGAGAPTAVGWDAAARRVAALDRALALRAVDPGGMLLVEMPAVAADAQRAAGAAATDPLAAKRARARARRATRRLAARLAADPGVRAAEPNRIVHAARVPRDPLYARQWHLAFLGLPRVWDVTVGAEDVVVAVIDTGVRSDHPDLAGRLLPGFDFIASPTRAADGDGLDADPFDPGDVPDDPARSSFHGTHVAATIAAASDDGLGVAGVGWRTRLLPVRVLGVGGGTLFDIAQGIRFAAGLPNVSGTRPAHPAAVINLSFASLGRSPTLGAAVEDAVAAGVLVVAAAGNTASASIVSPAGEPASLAVAATDRLGAPAAYSSFGPAIDLAAPGGDTGVDLDGDDAPDGVLSARAPGPRPHDYYQGTSMAAAQVSGVAALLLAAGTPSTAADVRAALEETAQDRGAPGRDPHYGAGLIDPLRALRRVARLPRPAAPELTLDTPVVSFGAERAFASVRVANVGGGTLVIGSVHARTDDGAPWLGAVFVPATTSVAVRVARDGLAPGRYAGTVTLDSNGGAQTLGVHMAVAAAAAPDVGRIRVVLRESGTGALVRDTTTDAARGYRFRLDAVPPGRYEVLATSAVGAAGVRCDPGDLCGAFPVRTAPTPIDLHGGEVQAGLDFALDLVHDRSGRR